MMVQWIWKPESDTLFWYGLVAHPEVSHSRPDFHVGT